MNTSYRQLSCHNERLKTNKKNFAEMTSIYWHISYLPDVLCYVFKIITPTVILFIQNCKFTQTFDRCYSVSDHRSNHQPDNSLSRGEFTKHGARRKQVYKIQPDHRNTPEFTEKPLNRVVFGFTELRHCKHSEFSSFVLAEGGVCEC